MPMVAVTAAISLPIPIAVLHVVPCEATTVELRRQWQAVVPESLYVLPASGRNCQP